MLAHPLLHWRMGRGNCGGGQERVNITVEGKVKNRYKTCGGRGWGVAAGGLGNISGQRK